MSLRLYNTMSRQVEEFRPLNPPKVGLYACGPTVYDYTHIGHLRKYVMDDVLVRVLKYLGYQVTFVRNITDVGHLVSDGDEGEDKLEKGSRKYKLSAWDLAKKFEDYFNYSMRQMNTLPPDVSCRATEHIPEQLEMVETLEKKGYTYTILDDGVYFDTSKLPDYGKLARLKLDKLKVGARVTKLKGKKNPTDFALWKFEKKGQKRQMVWESPWAKRSFPGWHIECSAMSAKYLGEQFDIHTGGVDHIAVHHTNEIAQAEAAFEKKPFVKYWVHHNFLQIEGKKMSKSLGNIYTIDDILKKGYHSMALRLLFLTAHYRSELDFYFKNLAGMQKALKKLVESIARWKIEDLPAVSSRLVGMQAGGRLKIEDRRWKLEEKKMSKLAKEYRKRFWEKMLDDLNTPEAVAVMWQVAKDEALSGKEKLALLIDFDQVLGLRLFKLTPDELELQSQVDINSLPPKVKELLKKRQQARKEKNWQEADRLRDKLKEFGYLVEDTAEGEKVKKTSAVILPSKA